MNSSCSTTDSQLDQQYHKDLLINHSMMLYLKEKIGFQVEQYELQALHVHGKCSDFHIHIQHSAPMVDANATTPMA